MMKSINLIIGAIAILLLVGCNKSTDFPNKALEKIIGEWEWEEASGGFAGITVTPASEGYTESLLFQNNGEYIKYRDSLEYQSYYYWIEEGRSIFSTEPAYLLRLGSRDHLTIDFTYSIDLEVDVLYLNEECNDCFRFKYSKKF
jgi:hypothetical protein